LASASPSTTVQSIERYAQAVQNASNDIFGSMPRHQSVQKKPLSNVRMSVEVRSQSRWRASTTCRTAIRTAERAREAERSKPWSLAHLTAQILPRVAIRSRVHKSKSRGWVAGLLSVQDLRSSASRTAADRGGGVERVSAAHVEQSQSTAGAEAGQSRKA
jgi:hypothetical protein